MIWHNILEYLNISNSIAYFKKDHSTLILIGAMILVQIILWFYAYKKTLKKEQQIKKLQQEGGALSNQIDEGNENLIRKDDQIMSLKKHQKSLEDELGVSSNKVLDLVLKLDAKKTVAQNYKKENDELKEKSGKEKDELLITLQRLENDAETLKDKLEISKNKALEDENNYNYKLAELKEELSGTQELHKKEKDELLIILQRLENDAETLKDKLEISKNKALEDENNYNHKLAELKEELSDTQELHKKEKEVLEKDKKEAEDIASMYSSDQAALKEDKKKLDDLLKDNKKRTWEKDQYYRLCNFYKIDDKFFFWDDLLTIKDKSLKRAEKIIDKLEYIKGDVTKVESEILWVLESERVKELKFKNIGIRVFYRGSKKPVLLAISEGDPHSKKQKIKQIKGNIKQRE